MSKNFDKLTNDLQKKVVEYLDYLTVFQMKYVDKKLYKFSKQSGIDKVLDLRNTLLQEENNTIYKILKKHRFLDTIIIEFKQINDTHIFLLGSNVKYVNINGCQRITDKSLIHFSKNCQNLERLEIYWIPSLTDNGLIPVIENCVNIRHLNLSGCKNISDNALNKIPIYMKHLEKIDLTRCTGVTDQMLNELVKNLDLIYLNLYALPYLNCDFLREISKKENSRMEFLDLCGNTIITDDLLIPALKNLRNLKYLNLSWCTSITDKSIEVLAANSYHLELLSVHGLIGITEKSLDSLYENKLIRKTLTTLDVHGCKEIVNKDENYLISKFTNLKCFKYHF